ncbi:hypothetical protein VTO73DRAFT_12691 [Trametes versicolor]
MRSRGRLSAPLKKPDRDLQHWQSVAEFELLNARRCSHSSWMRVFLGPGASIFVAPWGAHTHVKAALNFFEPPLTSVLRCRRISWSTDRTIVFESRIPLGSSSEKSVPLQRLLGISLGLVMVTKIPLRPRFVAHLVQVPMMAQIRRRNLDWSNKNWHPIPRSDAVLEGADCHGAIRRRRPSFAFSMPPLPSNEHASVRMHQP